jgi:hypothetical protein
MNHNTGLNVGVIFPRGLDIGLKKWNEMNTSIRLKLRAFVEHFQGFLTFALYITKFFEGLQPKFRTVGSIYW